MSLKIEKQEVSNRVRIPCQEGDPGRIEFLTDTERGASVTQACCNAVFATCYVLLNLTYLHTYHARLDTSLLLPFRTSLYPISLQRGSEKLDGAKPEETISVFNQLDAQSLFYNKFYFTPLHVSSACAHHQEVKIALHGLW